MELRQLRSFVAVAEEGSFTRAAARLHLAQPGVSAHVRRLEGELGDALFDRSGRSVRLTQTGAAALPYARAALEAAAGARLAADALLGVVRGRVTVGMVTACSSRELLDLLAAFHRDHPGVEIALLEDRSDLLLEALREGRIDLGFVGVAGPAPAGVELRRVAEERLVAGVAREDALADRASVGLDELARRPLVCLPRGTGIRSRLDEALSALGATPRIALEASNLGMVAELAARGLGAAVLPESVAAARKDLHALAITPALRSGLAFAWRAEAPPSPAARALVARARGRVNAPAGRPSPWSPARGRSRA
jgi:DNA-binding transcriptional LysR family regulator